MPRWQTSELGTTRGGSNKTQAQGDFRRVEPGGAPSNTAAVPSSCVILSSLRASLWFFGAAPCGALVTSLAPRVTDRGSNLGRGRDVALSIRSSILLTGGAPRRRANCDEPRGSRQGGAHRLSGEMALDALTNGSVARVQRLISRVEIPLPTGASVQVGHEYAAGDRVAAWRRIQIRFTHTLGM